jgi:hypothetical protein
MAGCHFESALGHKTRESQFAARHKSQKYFIKGSFDFECLRILIAMK